jgi:tetratricopeptide (TPR) repeat protein
METAVQTDDAFMADKKPTPIIRDAEQLLRRGIEQLEREHFDEAVGLLRQTIDLAPDSSLAALALGIALGRLLRIPEAVEALENAIALDPQGFYPHFRMAELHMRVGLVAQADEELTRAMDLSTSDSERRMVRELRALDRKRAPRRIWRPDFSRLLRKGRTSEP